MKQSKGSTMKKQILKFTVNGAAHEIGVAPNETLANVLRETLNLTGTKIGCDMGTCGCCTVHVDGRPQMACLTLALEYQGAQITTIEGLKQGGELHPLQKAFAECGGSQCGFCTPGFIMTAKALLEENASPTRDEIKSAIAGNLCRCTGFVKIYDAIEMAAKELRGEPVTHSDLHGYCDLKRPSQAEVLKV